LVPKDYDSIGISLKDVKKYGKEIEIHLKHSDFYLKTRKVLKGKVFGKRIRTVEELFDLQISILKSINKGLYMINGESRYNLERLETYIENINNDYEYNFLGIGFKKEFLESSLKDYDKTYQEFKLLKKKDKNFFDVERKLRALKREITENDLDYKKMLDTVDDLNKEKSSLNALEDFFRFNIHLSERMVDKSVRFENHLINTKDSYMMAKNINQGFKAVLSAIRESSNTVSNLQRVLTDGLVDMGTSFSDKDLVSYNDFEILLGSKHRSVHNLIKNSDKEKELELN